MSTESVFEQRDQRFLDVGDFFDVEQNSRVLLPQQAYYAAEMAEEDGMDLSLDGVTYLTTGAARHLVRAEQNGVEIWDCNKIVERALEQARGSDRLAEVDSGLEEFGENGE